MQQTCDVLIVGAGPGGASCAYWLAKLGVSAVVVEKKVFPREKTCGDGLTPRSVHQLEQMGMSGFLQSQHRYKGLRTIAFGHEMELNWPQHPELPDYGYVVSRHDLDGAVAENAVEAGATLIQGVEAVEAKRGPQGDAASVTVKSKDGSTTEYLPRFLVVADGSNSRIGRQLGASRDRSLPMGLALRGYFNSPLSDEGLIESHLDIRTPQGEVMPGYGWIFPMGDGRVNVGVGILSTLGRWKEVNTTKVLEAFVATAPPRWKLDSSDPIYVGTGGKLPMGFSVGPRVGPNFVIVGDAAGSINPFNGEGIAYGYETGRLAAEVIADALALDDSSVLRRYERDLDARYGDYYRIARTFVGLIGHPAIMHTVVSAGIRSKMIMDPVMRVMANLMNEGHYGPAEVLYRAGIAGLAAKDRLDPLWQAGKSLAGTSRRR